METTELSISAPAYGSVVVAGLTLDQAKAAIEQHLREHVKLLDPLVSVSLSDIAGKQPVSGEHLVRPDGTVGLGIYGEGLRCRHGIDRRQMGDRRAP